MVEEYSSSEIELQCSRHSMQRLGAFGEEGKPLLTSSDNEDDGSATSKLHCTLEHSITASLLPHITAQHTRELYQTSFSGGSSTMAESHERYWELAIQCMRQAEKLISSTLLQFNHGQCQYLVWKLSLAVQAAHASGTFSPGHGAVCIDILKLIFRLAKEVETFILNCCKDEWIHAVILMTNGSQHVSTLSFYLDLCTALFRNSTKSGAALSIHDDHITGEVNMLKEKASLDQSRLVERLETLVRTTNPRDPECQLSTYILNRLTAASALSPPDLSRLSRLSHWKIEYSSLERKEKLGTGAAGTVHKAVWLEAEVAEKLFVGSDHPSFNREVSILAGLSHPNITSLLCYAMDRRNCSIVMELMDGDLSQLMQNRLQRNSTLNAPFPILEAVDIMLQIADGVYYLHEQRVVHRDLKSSNVLVKCVKPSEVDVEFVYAKVADFGLSRTKESSCTFSNQTPNTGSTRWMAPELHRGNHVHEELQYPFKSDVYSFGMVCYEILTGEMPFSDISSLLDVRKKVTAGRRPQLPGQCPYKLYTLIESCWKPDASARPSFADICANLRHLKCLLLTSNRVADVLWENIMVPQNHMTSLDGYSYDGDILVDIDGSRARSSEDPSTGLVYPSTYEKDMEFWDAKTRRNRKQSSASKNEIYMLIALHTVSQVIMLSAVSESNFLHCNSWWNVFLLSVVPCVAIVIGVILKFQTVLELERIFESYQKKSRQFTVEQSEKSSSEGPGIRFHAKDGNVATERKSISSLKLTGCMFAVIVVLLLFTSIILGCFRQILCT